MTHIIKIDNQDFLIDGLTIQLSIVSHATINIEIDIKKYPEYEDIFFKKYENNDSFTILAKLFQAMGTKIKTIDIDRNSNQMNLSLRCDIFESKTIGERREELIDTILDIETLNNQNNTIITKNEAK
jgi:hypothetical protein